MSDGMTLGNCDCCGEVVTAPININVTSSQTPYITPDIDGGFAGFTGIPVTSSVADKTGKTECATNCTFLFDHTVTLQLTAPADVGCRKFYGWKINGVLYAVHVAQFICASVVSSHKP